MVALVACDCMVYGLCKLRRLQNASFVCDWCWNGHDNFKDAALAKILPNTL